MARNDEEIKKFLNLNDTGEARPLKPDAAMVKNDDEFAEGFDRAVVIGELEDRIQHLKSLPSITPTDERHKREDLQMLKAELTRKKEEFGLLNKLSPEEVVAKLKAKGRPVEEIAYTLYSVYGASSYQIGSLLPAKPGAIIEKESISRRGRTLLKRYFAKNPDKIR